MGFWTNGCAGWRVDCVEMASKLIELLELIGVRVGTRRPRYRYTGEIKLRNLRTRPDPTRYIYR